MIERYLLRYFLAVVDSGNFSTAAASANVTQPTLSAGIAKLEDQLGKPLFHRNNRRVHLTEAGARLLPYARRIESQFNQSIAAVQQVEPIRMLRMGILQTVSSTLISASVQSMLSQDSNLRIEIVDGSERDLTSKLAQGRIDLALTLVDRGGDRFAEEVLFEEGYVAALPTCHALADRTALKAEDLADSVMIVRRQCEALSETSRFFTERGVRPFFAYRSSQDDRVMAMIKAGLGLTIVPQSHCDETIPHASLSGFNLRRKIGFAYSSEVDTEEIRAFKGLVVFAERLRDLALEAAKSLN